MTQERIDRKGARGKERVSTTSRPRLLINGEIGKPFEMACACFRRELFLGKTRREGREGRCKLCLEISLVCRNGVKLFTG